MNLLPLFSLRVVGMQFSSLARRAAQEDAEAAVARGEYPLIAILDPEGLATPGSSGDSSMVFETHWYFESSSEDQKTRSGLRLYEELQRITPHLKVAGQSARIEENVASVKANPRNKQKHEDAA